MAAEKMLLHGVEEAFFSEVVINEFLRLLNGLVAHGERQGDLLDGMDVERALGPFIDQADRFFQQGCIAVGDTAQPAVIQLETIVGGDAVSLQATPEFDVVGAFADVAPVVLETVHDVAPGVDPFEDAMGRLQEQRIGVDEQGLLCKLQPLGDSTGLAPVVIAVFALPLGQGLLVQGDGVDRPASIILGTIGHDPDAQRLTPFELCQGGEHAELGFAPVDILVAIDEVEQLVRCFFQGGQRFAHK
ncbi:hypothetical protein D3C75_775520 [compost metagenome]